MKLCCLALAGALLVVLATGAGAATTDIKAIRTKISRSTGPSTCSTSPPVEDNLICLKVVVQNLGPDTYVGTGPAKAWNSTLAGRLQISVDIDEPSKPTPGPGVQVRNFTQDFAVTIAPGDSAELDFGVVEYKTSPGTYNAHMTATAQSPNVDPNPANNDTVTAFTVLAFTPAAERTSLLFLGLGMAAAGAWVLARRARARA
jgi:hypothetical protein